jgi:hypothetical protein
MPSAGTATLLGIFLIVAVIVAVAVCRMLAEIIRDINRHEHGLAPHKRKRK